MILFRLDLGRILEAAPLPVALVTANRAGSCPRAVVEPKEDRAVLRVLARRVAGRCPDWPSRPGRGRPAPPGSGTARGNKSAGSLRVGPGVLRGRERPSPSSVMTHLPSTVRMGGCWGERSSSVGTHSVNGAIRNEAHPSYGSPGWSATNRYARAATRTDCARRPPDGAGFSECRRLVAVRAATARCGTRTGDLGEHNVFDRSRPVVRLRSVGRRRNCDPGHSASGGGRKGVAGEVHLRESTSAEPGSLHCRLHRECRRSRFQPKSCGGG